MAGGEPAQTGQGQRSAGPVRFVWANQSGMQSTHPKRPGFPPVM